MYAVMVLKIGIFIDMKYINSELYIPEVINMFKKRGFLLLRKQVVKVVFEIFIPGYKISRLSIGIGE